MKRISLIISLIVLGFILQTSFMSSFNFFSVIPNISLILVVIFAMLSGGLTGGILGLITGILYDAMIYDIFGVYTLIYFFIGAIIGSFSDDMLRENYLVYSTVTGISTLVMHLLVYLILFFLRFRVELAASILPKVLFEIIINTVFVIFVLKFVIYLFDKLKIKV